MPVTRRVDDSIIRYFGGPRDGEAVRLPPELRPLRGDDGAAETLPPRIECPTGSYYFIRSRSRYEWRNAAV